MAELVLTQQMTKTLIVGLGETGLSCARHLAALGQPVAITDSRAQPPGLERLRSEVPDAAVFVGGFSEEALARCDRVVVSPGVCIREPFIRRARDLGLEIVGDIELFAREAVAPVVAVTGSNGKSTVTTLVGMMLKRAGLDARVGGNIGTPALDLIDAAEPDFYVLELSSFQLETTESLAPEAATVLNVTPDHMDRYDSAEDYAAAKARIYRNASVAVINRDDAAVTAMAGERERVVRFGGDRPEGTDYGLVDEAGECWLVAGGEHLLSTRRMHLEGRHNLTNALAAAALAEAVGCPRDAVVAALAEFRGLPHRMEWIARLDGVDYINDSKATNVGATLAAVRGMGRSLVLIAGGDAKNADFDELGRAMGEYGRAVVVIGRDAERIARAMPEGVPVERADTIDRAVHVARQLAKPGDAVLLSPACSSLDMFADFADRGRRFAEAVRGFES